MIIFAPLRTRRLDVQLQELSIGDEIALCHLPEKAHEKSLTAFLERAVKTAAAPTDRHISSPRAWSVGERLLSLAHYCIHVREDGPDYAVTDTSRLSDYLDIAKDISGAPVAFEACDDHWVMHPLIGAAVEVLEGLQGQMTLAGREFWIVGAMAAQLLRQGEVIPDPVADYSQYSDWLQKRIATMALMPSSGFEKLFIAYSEAMQSGGQFFRIWFDEMGVIVLPREAGAMMPPARFPVRAAIGGIAPYLAGKAL